MGEDVCTFMAFRASTFLSDLDFKSVILFEIGLVDLAILGPAAVIKASVLVAEYL